MSCGQVKKFTDSLFFLDKDKLFGNRTSKIFDVLARGTSENFLDFFTPVPTCYKLYVCHASGIAVSCNNVQTIVIALPLSIDVY